MNDCIFCKIAAGEIPSTKLYEDELCVAFNDANPMAPVHFLVIPKEHFASAAEVTADNASVIGHIYEVIAKLASELGISDGFRVVTNVGSLAGQTVRHIHFHVLSGKQLGSFD
ncbi:MAG: histidine triad nucleotide-binding protein [Oscillospiraceae bacterium]|jgi:histidine triad (HIT) family protein|nr:histidine triad nucleotide-binding protein [Oscillospiraceae bacterium]